MTLCYTRQKYLKDKYDMIWKRKNSNLIVAAILSLAYTIVTLLNIIGPLHVNATGQVNQIGWLAGVSILYWVAALVITWGTYFILRKKPEILFFTLIVMGIVIIVFENYLWGLMGSV